MDHHCFDARQRRTPIGIARALAAAVAALSWAGTAPAEPADDGARMERVADGVYAIVHDDATDEWPHGNTGVIVGDDSVLVVDSAYLPSRARADIALIRGVTDKPVGYLVITHWHFDHNNGSVAYREAFPGIRIVSERATRDFVDLNATWWAKMSTAAGSARRASLEELETQLDSGEDSDGGPLTAQGRRDLETAIRQRRAELEELAALTVVRPDLVFEGTLSLDLGNRPVVLEDRGRANSPHDVTVWLPNERVLFAGDIIVQSPLPYTGASWPVPWIDVLRALEAIPVTALVPGHGPVMHDHAYTRQVRELLEAVTTRVAALARQGRTLEQIQAEIDLDDQRKGVWDPSDPVIETYWKTVTDVLVERAWRGVRGQG
jgi:glyoxylase-like metal-dependent hydrolase (beta-lactamase superfamily II)